MVENPVEHSPDPPSRPELLGGQFPVPASQPPPLPLWLRITLLLIGWLLVLIGIAGLVLPGIQGIATIVIGAAVLSLASELAYELLERTFKRWPAAWVRVEKFRTKMHDWLHRGRG